MKVLAIVLLCAATCLAQTTRPEPVKSPEVHSDRTVTFRLRAPEAREVTLTGDWMPERSNAPFTKGAEGIWSVTVGPLDPGAVIYGFNIDGVAVPDPVNPKIKLRAETSGSLVDVPGDGSEPFAVRDVPHGAVRMEWHKSAVLEGQTREFRVYTPPGYEQNPAERYPVLYLLHGSNDTPAGWMDVGQVNFIMDNMIAEKRVVPMVIVMPFGHATPFRERRNNDALFERYLLEDLMPVVEKRYRLLPGPNHRALAGASMGGEQALKTGLRHLDLFATIGAFAASIPRDIETTLKPTLDQGAAANAKLKLLWLGCGKSEGRYASNEQLIKLLADHHIESIFVGAEAQENRGQHNYALWRKFFIEMAPLMFRERQSATGVSN